MFILTFIEGTKQSHYIVHVVPTFVVILVSVFWALFTRMPAQRPILAMAALLLVIIQIGPALFRIRENPYRKDWLPTIQAARPFVDADA